MNENETCTQPPDDTRWTVHVHVHGPDDVLTFADPTEARIYAESANDIGKRFGSKFGPLLSAHVIAPGFMS